MKKTYILFFLFLFGTTSMYAQDKKERTTFETGEIIVMKEHMKFDDDYTQSSGKYQESIIGIATGNQSPRKVSDYCQKEGIAMVKVCMENGAIKKGDLITTSSQKGTGMKATSSGMMVGVATQDANADGLLQVRLLMQYVKQ